MKASIHDVKFDEKTGILSLSGEAPLISTAKPNLVVRERINTRYMFIPKSFELSTRWLNGSFTAQLNMDQHQELLSEGEVWDLYFLYDNQKVLLDLVNISSKSYSYYPLKETLFELKPFITKTKNLSLWVKPKDIMLDIKEFNISESGLFLKIVLHVEASCRARITFTNTINKKLNIQDHQYHINGETPGSNIFTFKIIQGLIPCMETINKLEKWEATLQVFQKDRVVNFPLILPSLEDVNGIKDSLASSNVNPFFMSRFILKQNNELGIEVVKKDIAIKVDNFTFDEKGKVIIRGVIESPELSNLNFKITNILLQPRSKHPLARLPIEGIKIPIFSSNGHYMSEFILDSVLETNQLNDNCSIDVFAEIIDEFPGAKTLIPIINPKKISFGYTSVKDGYEVKPYQTSNGNLAFWLRERKEYRGNQQNVKVAVLGSCYSRAAFNSSDYFNPGYKEKYQVVYSQFHSAIPSIMSEPIKYEGGYFQHYNDTEKVYIQDDLEKHFFHKLDKSKPDFLIIDFYSDIFLDLIVIDSEHIITGNYFIRGSEFLLNLPNTTRIISRENLDPFISLWKKSVSQFADKIKNYIQEDRIILQKARSIDRYYDEDHQIKHFKNPNNIIDMNNYLYEYLESYFLKLMPNTQVIDLNNSNFIGHHAYPNGNSFNHYEPKFYKEFMNKLDSIVMKSLLK
ncbi:MAG: DUF6270 domain-containing protein [Bacillota bacterium]